MEYDNEARRADEPEKGAEWGGPPEEGKADDEETDVQRLLGHDVVADLHWLWGWEDARWRGNVSGGGSEQEGCTHRSG